MLYQIDIGYGCFGVVVEEGRITEAAPMGRWMIGKTLPYIRAWVNTKRGTIKEVKAE